VWIRTFPVKWVYFEVISELSQPRTLRDSARNEREARRHQEI
jgi:hypothetical protein